jgi:hypothetical protein
MIRKYKCFVLKWIAVIALIALICYFMNLHLLKEHETKEFWSNVKYLDRYQRSIICSFGRGRLGNQVHYFLNKTEKAFSH